MTSWNDKFLACIDGIPFKPIRLFYCIDRNLSMLKKNQFKVRQ